jgi:hypothetical protein
MEGGTGAISRLRSASPQARIGQGVDQSWRKMASRKGGQNAAPALTGSGERRDFRDFVVLAFERTRPRL